MIHPGFDGDTLTPDKMAIRLVPATPFVPPTGHIEQSGGSIIMHILQIPSKIAPQVEAKWKHHKNAHTSH
jgi:hypothetical protein